MKHLKRLGILTAAIALAAIFGAGAASATTLEVGGVTRNQAVTVEASLASGTSTVFKDTENVTADTCTASIIKGTTQSPFTSSTVTAPLSSLTFTGCSHSTSVIKPGKLHFAWTSGTNATVSSSEAEVTIQWTIFGATFICKSGAGAPIGTLTGSASHATLDINGVLTCPFGITTRWTGTYTVTSPTGLGVEN
jgi:hypothetical protein